MARNTSVALSDHFEAYARRKVASGEFATISEVIRDALRRMEERDRRLGVLEAAVAEGVASGIDHEFDFDHWLDVEFPEDECRAAAAE